MGRQAGSPWRFRRIAANRPPFRGYLSREKTTESKARPRVARPIPPAALRGQRSSDTQMHCPPGALRFVCLKRSGEDRVHLPCNCRLAKGRSSSKRPAAWAACRSSLHRRAGRNHHQQDTSNKSPVNRHLVKALLETVDCDATPFRGLHRAQPPLSSGEILAYSTSHRLQFPWRLYGRRRIQQHPASHLFPRFHSAAGGPES